MDPIITYRYIRLALVCLACGIFAAILIQRTSPGVRDFEDSISHYYYTPARGMFVAALFAIGACLICVRGGTEVEEGLLNIAGMLAPVVALVPTPPSTADVQSIANVLHDRQAGVANNFVALIVLGAVALILLVFIALTTGRRHARSTSGDLYGLGAGAGLVASAFVWYKLSPDTFLHYAHNISAVGMFGCIAVVAILDGRRVDKLSVISTNARACPVRGKLYVGLGASMLIFGGGILLANKIHKFSYAVLLAESVLITLFAVFWVMQTVDLWGHISRKDFIARRALK